LQHLLETVILPQQKFEIEHAWSGIMGIGPHKSYILQSVYPHVHVGVRMGGMGVALGSLVGMKLGNCLDHDL
jgi:gamma-glutamylputrescine oxidase